VPVSDHPDNIAVPAHHAAGPTLAEDAVPAVAVPKLAPGDRVQDPFLVNDVAQRSYQGGTMTVLTLGNHTGSIESAPFFDADQAKLAGVARGTVAQVIGEVTSYRDKRQLSVTSLRVLPTGTVPWDDLLPSVGDVSRYWKALDGWRAEIRGPRLRAVLDLFYEDPGFRARYEACPASPVGHHAELGGLLKHTAEVAAIARGIVRVTDADPDLVLAGVLLHDIGKLEAYRWDGPFSTTDRGYLYGHVVLGTLMLERAVRGAAPMPCTEEELDLLQHLVLSHHGRQEFGAPVPPMTLEAEILHHADLASARTASMQGALEDDTLFEGDARVTARTVWQLDRRRAYRGRSDWGR
jgi:3'-5' exoribonuclease